MADDDSRPTDPYPFKGIAKSLVDADSPDLLRDLVDEDQAFDVLAYAAGTDNITPGQQQSAIKQVYDATQSWLKDRPDTITVYRYGELRGDEPVSFTLDPNFTGKSLPWLDRTGSEGLQAYTVNKEDILAAPSAVLRPGMGTDTEYEVIIPGSRVFSVGDDPRPTDPSVLEKGLMASDIGSRVAGEIRDLKKPKGQELVKQEKAPSKGQMFRGIGSLMRGRISPIVTAAQLFWGEMPDSVKDDAGEIVDWLRENKMQDLVGLEKSGLEYFKEALGTDVPKLSVDNPGGDWLARKIKYAEEKGRNEYGAPHLGDVTASFREKVNLPVDLLATFKGRRGEQGQVREKDLARLKKHMEETGKLPLSDPDDPASGEYAPFITVGYDGVPWVSEGNHRIMAAKALGWKTLPVELRYFDGGERTEGLLSPEKVRTMYKDPKYQLDESGLEYFKEALGLAPQEPKGIMSLPPRSRADGGFVDKSLYN
jgi:hypothetical protein